MIKESPIDTLGLFAADSISEGEIVVIRTGNIIDEKELIAHKDIIGNADLQIADNFYLAPLTKEEFINVMTYVNHSCEPNLGIMGNCIFVTMRDIEAGEELCLDYAMFDNNNDRFACNCKTPSCRKIITGRDWQKKDLQEKYGNYFSSFLLKKIIRTG
jgi:SET domain-containing protein